MKKLTAITLFGLAGASFALQGGPTQPDYAQFEPSGMQDMVSLQSGDFSYQIPLSDIPSPYGNYPLSLSYHAGISPQQEATWVGLGWSLNPGSINRDVRGVPDDQFHGGTLGFIYQYSSTQIWSVDLGYSIGIFSVGQNFSSDGSVGFSATVGPKIAGVVGVGFTVGTDAVGVEASVGNDYAKLNAGLMFSTKDGKPNATVGASIGVAGASMGAQVSTGSGASARVGFGNSKAGVGLSVSSNGVTASAHVGQVSMSKSKNGASVSVGGGTISVSNSSNKGTDKTSTAGFAIVVPTQIGVFSFGFSQTTFEYWMRSATSEYVYGYLYQAGPGIDVSHENDVQGSPDAYVASRTSKNKQVDWKWNMKGRSLESLGNTDMSPAYDMYSVSSEGAAGSFRPFAREKHLLYKKVTNEATDGKETIESYNTIMNDCGRMPCGEEFVYTTKANGDKELTPIENDSIYNDYQKCFDKNGKDCSIYALYKTNYRNKGNKLLFNSKDNEYEERGGMRFVFVGEGSGYYESEDVHGAIGRPVESVSDLLLKRSIGSTEYALYGSKKVKPLFEDDSPMGKLRGFEITTSDGSKYIFGQPVRSYLKVDYSINQAKGIPVFVDKSSSKYDNFWKNLWDGVKMVGAWVLDHIKPWSAAVDVYNFVFSKGHLDETCTTGSDSKSDDYYYSYTVNMNPHATQWLITEVRGADFVAFANDTIGYNVKFKYTEPSIYKWRTPYSKPGTKADELPNFRVPHDGLTPEGCDSKMYQASFGIKEYVYLKSIETSTHRVEFKLNEKERADGKGWSASGVIPIMVQASIGFDVAKSNTESISLDGSRVQGATMTPKNLYFNSPLPKDIQEELYKKKINIQGLGFNGESIEGAICKIRMLSNNISKGYEVTVKDSSYAKTSGDEIKYGLYKIGLEGKVEQVMLSYSDKNRDSVNNEFNNKTIVFGENGDMPQNPYIDWSEFVFAATSTQGSGNPYNNQMRYLDSIKYYVKNSNNKDSLYHIYSFDYDYSLQPKTLNSYCENLYPDSVEQIKESPDSVGVDICQTENVGKHLYGKLTLRSIKETGCQNGKCASLPPFKFSYASPSATSTRISTKDGWVDFFQGNSVDEEGNKVSQFPESYLDSFGDIDATILASSNTTDEYGFWSTSANIENHKVDQSFADFGASAWSLNKVVDPAGGNLEIEYERDTYAKGEDYSKELNTIEFESMSQCNGKQLCFKVVPMYWHDQCLGPRAAYWDSKLPKNFNGNPFAYIDSMGVGAGAHIFFNMLVDVKTKVKCGLFGVGRCSRTRSVAVLGDAKVNSVYRISNDAMMIVLDKDYGELEKAAKKAASKINNDQSWSLQDGYGYLWTSKKYDAYKAGDLRVTKMTRHDINIKSQTSYEYAEGEIAQLADSAYTTVLGNRFFGSKVAYAMPDTKMDPISRIVGFNDDDLMFVPGPRISYPKVTVKNSSEGGLEANGSTEFSYITPETGIPEEYISETTKKDLKPFLKLNLRHIIGDPDANFDDGRIFKISLLDTNGQVLREEYPNGENLSKTIIMFADEVKSLYFYSDSIQKVRKIRVRTLKTNGYFNTDSSEIKIAEKFKLTNDSTDSRPMLGKFNEIMTSLQSQKSVNEPGYFNSTWSRSQKPGYYPILYKKIEYTSEKIDLNAAGNPYGIDTIRVAFEKNITYHDLTAFLGLNYKTVFKRGNSSDAIIVKMDSSIYSTEIPDYEEGVASNLTSGNKYKVGRQVEKWSTETQMQCVNEAGNNDLKGTVEIGDDDKEICKEQHMDLYMRRYNGAKNKKEFTYIRYPAFQIGSVNYIGHDNQENGTEPNKFGKTEMRNHAFDPIMGSPTATLATSRIDNGKVSRKLTKMTPYYKIQTALADSMFLRNMFTQNYMEAVYTDTLENANDSAWTNVWQKDNLRSFSVSPYRFAIDSNVIVAWGTYQSAINPDSIIDSAFVFARGDTLPSLLEYSGTHIVSIDNNMKVTEVVDAQGRSMSTLFSRDGMNQLALFFPAKLDEVGAILPYHDSVYSSDSCSKLNKTIKNGTIMMGDSTDIYCKVSTRFHNAVKEYRWWHPSRGWEAKREEVPANSVVTRQKVTLGVPKGAKLSYFRVYPANAESKAYVYDRYNNMIQSVAEDNTSTFYEYDPLGNLVQSRNDDGVSFKAHHREYMNDTTTLNGRGE